jgi:hypothetical protein
MKEQNWTDIECQCESITNSLDVIDEALADIRSVRLGKRINQLLTTISNEVDNVRLNSDRVYSTCEDDYCSTNNEYFRADDWEELTELLPDPTLMSAGDMNSLLDAVNNWRVSCGLPSKR